jgi:polar amino acid transport system substrate-binding protein
MKRLFGRLLVGVPTLMLVTAGLLAGGRGVHAADSILTDVLRRGTVRIAISVGNPPTRFEDENGNLQGYDIDIANLLASKLGATIEWIRTDTAGRVAMLQTKKADITIASFTPNLERLKSIGFTDPYLTDVLSLLSRADRKELGSLADFNKPEIKIAIPRGSTAAKAIATYLPKATVVEFSGNADTIAALDAGQVDAACAGDALVNWTAKNGGGKYRNAAALGPPEDDAIGFPQGDFVWWLWLNRFVREINEDGTNYTLWVKWFGDSPMPFFIKPPPKSG